MNRKLSILVLDDETRLVEEIGEFLEAKGFEVVSADRPSSAFSRIEGRAIDLALIDIKLPEYDGLEFIKRLKASRPTTETIVMSGHGDMGSVIKAFRLGAFDYLRKPFTSADLQAALGRTTRYMEALGEAREYAALCAQLNRELAGDGDFVGESAGMLAVRDQIALAAAHPDAPVLVRGESGTGKELVARRIHGLSSRASARFVAVNCAAIPAEMFESEFFGHERGAFTDARNSRTGLFRSAHGGTLFLDEVGDLPLELQAKLLRAIEEKAVRPVGSDEERASDARIDCATNRDLAERVAAGAFRQDLYYRLAVLEIALPPLRDRISDIPALGHHFLRRAGLDDQTIDSILDSPLLAALASYSYPGNVRELRNFMERVAILRREPTSAELETWLSTSPRDHAAPGSRQASIPPDGDLNLDELETRAVREAMKRSNGNHSAAARLLGISRQVLDRRLERIGARLH